VFSEIKNKELPIIKQTMLNELKTFSENLFQQDDITVLILKNGKK
jgi:hypothetical protein